MSPCHHSDAVLAHFLDGDANATPDANPQELTEHLEGCDVCRNALQSGRRLDALLAAQAGQRMDGSSANAILKAALARVTPTAPAPTRRLPLRLLTGTGLLAAGFAAAWLLLPRPDPDPVPSLPVAQIGPQIVSPYELTDAILLTDSPPRRRPPRRRPQAIAIPRTGIQVQALASLFVDPSLESNLRTNLWTRSLSLGLPRVNLASTASRLADDLRLRAADALLQSDHRDALGTWTQLVAAVDDGPVLRQLLAAGRNHLPLHRRLRHQLRELRIEPASLAVAARLALPELDERLVGAVRRDPLRAGEVAEHLAAVRDRPHRVALLLDLWTDLRARGQLQDDEDAARRLLAAQPQSATIALIEEATTTGNAPRRQRCLLALAVRRDPRSREFLVSEIRSPSQPDAILAAYALSQLPAETIASVLEATPTRRGRRLWLLQAAMAGARCARVTSWLPEMDLTPEERQFLAAGSFTRDQFPIAAALFRERGISGF
jgi:hypothetical protein